MEALSVVMPLVATVFGAVLTFMTGQISSKLNGISANIDQVDARLKSQLESVEARMQLQITKMETSHYNHIIQPNIHGEAVAKLTEQINQLLNTVQIAHERIDTIKGRT